MLDGVGFFIEDVLDLLFANLRWYRKKTKDNWYLITSPYVANYGCFWIRVNKIYRFFEEKGDYRIIAIERHGEK